MINMPILITFAAFLHALYTIKNEFIFTKNIRA